MGKHHDTSKPGSAIIPKERDFLHTCNSYSVGSIKLALVQKFAPISG